MGLLHSYSADVVWTGAGASGTASYTAYSRDQHTRVPGRREEAHDGPQAVDDGGTPGDRPRRGDVEAQLVSDVGQEEPVRQPDQPVGGGDQGGPGGEERHRRPR